MNLQVNFFQKNAYYSIKKNKTGIFVYKAEQTIAHTKNINVYKILLQIKKLNIFIHK
jgi:hypothetical protein